LIASPAGQGQQRPAIALFVSITPSNVSLMPEVVEHLGGVSYAYTDAGRDNSLIAEVRGKPGLKVGNELRLGVRPVDCLLFDGDGKRL
jgi:hypothetical protein